MAEDRQSAVKRESQLLEGAKKIAEINKHQLNGFRWSGVTWVCACRLCNNFLSVNPQSGISLGGCLKIKCPNADLKK